MLKFNTKKFLVKVGESYLLASIPSQKPIIITGKIFSKALAPQGKIDLERRQQQQSFGSWKAEG